MSIDAKSDLKKKKNQINNPDMKRRTLMCVKNLKIIEFKFYRCFLSWIIQTWNLDKIFGIKWLNKF